MSVDELEYVFPQAGINGFAISVFQAMRHTIFSATSKTYLGLVCQPIHASGEFNECPASLPNLLLKPPHPNIAWRVCVCVQVQEERAVT